MIRIPIERHHLDNGMRVILSRDPASAVVAINLWYNVGSRNERPGRTGFAHLFEHMMFQGSEHVPEMQHFALIEKAGGSLNGSTWLDRTNYYETLPAHFLELGLWLESDRLGWLLPALTQDKLDNQRNVVKNERRWRVDNQPYGDWDERIQTMVFPDDHPYHHSVIGSMEDIDAATVEDVERFFRTYYAPNNAVLTLCGGFEAGPALALVERYFGPIPAGPTVPPMPGRSELAARIGGEPRQRVAQDISLERVFHAYRTPPYGSAEFYMAAVTAAVLGTGKAARLYRSLVAERMLAQEVSAFAFPIVVGASTLVVSATARPGASADELDQALAREIAGLEEVTDADIRRAIRLIEAKHLDDLQRVDERADMLSMYTTLFDDPERINTELSRVQEVTATNVREFARDYLVPDNRAVLEYVRQRDGVPGRASAVTP